MPKAIDLLRQGKHEELWQMCCGFLSLDVNQFMEIQKSLLLQQLDLLGNCALGEKLFHGYKPKTIEEFRRLVPLTSYKDYCPELLEKREDTLPTKPAQWVHSSGKSGEYSFKWVPLSEDFCRELSKISYGVGLLSSCEDWKDMFHTSECPKLVYAVAPRPYMSGALASMIGLQTPSRYMPPLEEAEGMSFEERIAEGFSQALSEGFDYFFGMSLVLVTVGNRFSESSSNVSIRPLLKKPKALFRLIKGMAKSKLAGRPIMPKDLWSVKGIMCGGLDSWVFRDKIKNLWGRYPLDVYAGTEGGIYATQTWDYDSMTFIPNLNFFEFMPEEEQIKLQMDSSYQPKTFLLDEVEADTDYELIITNFHGGALVRYRPGDIIRITNLHNDKLGINLPQMVFQRRADDIIDFNVVRFSEKSIWQALEKTGVPYEDWIAHKEPGEQVLNIFLEAKKGVLVNEEEMAAAIYEQLTMPDDSESGLSVMEEDTRDMVGFDVAVKLLPVGTFAEFTAQRRAEGADLAHLKPAHVNPNEEVITLLVVKPQKTIVESYVETEKTTV